MKTRRELLCAAVAAAPALLTLPALAQGGPSERMATRPIPSSGERLPVIGAGTAGSFNVTVGSPEYVQLSRVVEIFFEAGASVIDTSPNYQRSDEVLGQLLAASDRRSRTFLATKIAADSAAEARSQWAGSLARLRTDRVDLLQIHNLRAWQDTLPVARELKAAGQVRYVGITHYREHALDEMARLLRNEPLDFIQINYSVNATAAAKTVLPLAQDRGVAVIVNRAFDDGRLFAAVRDRPLPAWAAEVDARSWAQLFLKFAISHPAVTVVIPATGRPDRQADNLRAGFGPLLSAAQQQALAAMFT